MWKSASYSQPRDVGTWLGPEVGLMKLKATNERREAVTAHVERVMPLQFTSYTYATLSEASSPPSAGITAAHVAGGKPDHTQGGAVRCARPLGRGRLGPGPPHSVQHLPITRLKEGPEGGGSCAPSTGQPSWSMPLLPPPAAPPHTWKWGLDTQRATCLKRGSWIFTNWEGSMTSRISSISPRNITCRRAGGGHSGQ